MSKSLYLAPIALALALSGCGGAADTESGVTSGDALETVAAPDGQQWSQTVSITEAGGYVMGNPDAPIKLVEYMSLTCGACAQFGDQAFDSIREDYVNSGRVSFEIRNFVRDPADLTAALLTRCSTEQAYFPLAKSTLSIFAEFFQKFIDLNNSGEVQKYYELPENERFVKIGEEIGLISAFTSQGISEDQAKACLADTDKLKQLTEWTNSYANEDNVQGTPTFLINGQQVEGTGWNLIETKLKEAGAR
ncbi:MAG: thioredoxin domain-containing protein [Parasphingorhabdus sp.]|uniref:thioredoxin domain-containing protein n=1 Tax=Parasphingorhabdus sp. TaxID=2709688 RepID=UPI0032999529